MSKKIIFLLLVIFSRLPFSAQTKTDTLHLFFEINQNQNNKHLGQLDSLFNSCKEKNCDLKIYGYADFLSSDASNKNLSQKRAEAVRTYLANKTGNSVFKISECRGFGEINSSDNHSNIGEPSQRRVDIIVKQIVKTTSTETKIEPKKKIVKAQDGLSPSKNELNKKDISQMLKGESLTLDGLSFEPGRHFILRESVPVLEKLLLIMQENENLKIEIQGHVCCSAGDGDGFDNDSKDMKLSEHRAQVVYNYLIKKGIDKSRLTYIGYGHSRPKIAQEMSLEDEQTNRRVEIKVIEN